MPASAAAGPTGMWSDAAWDWTLGVNLRAVIWGIEIFGPLIERHGEGGHIVSTASIAGLVSNGSSAYNVSKYGVVALSEGLRLELAPRGIGVSVLCPGFIRTQIVDSGRNLPERFAGKVGRAPATGPIAERVKFIRDRVAQGIDPLYVGELVREGIDPDWPYIFTDNELEPFIDARFAAIKEGFNRIRGRIPRRSSVHHDRALLRPAALALGWAGPVRRHSRSLLACRRVHRAHQIPASWARPTTPLRRPSPRRERRSSPTIPRSVGPQSPVPRERCQERRWASPSPSPKRARVSRTAIGRWRLAR